MSTKGAPLSPALSLAFTAWFGTGKSVHVDGMPQVMYHGSKTPENLTRFVPGGLENSRRSGDAYGMAAYLTSSPREASFYAGDEGAVFPVYVRGNLLNLQCAVLDAAGLNA